MMARQHPREHSSSGSRVSGSVMATTMDAARLPRHSSAHIRVAWLCAGVLLMEGYDIASVGYALPALIDRWRVPPGSFTASLTAGNVGLLLGSLAAGFLGERRGRKPVLIASVVIFGACSLATALAASPAQLAVLRLLTGIGLGGGLPMAIALAADFAPSSAPGRFVLTTIAAVPIGFTVSGLLAVAVIGSLGWHAIFLIGGAAPLLFSPLLSLHLPESPAFRSRALRPPNVASLFTDGRMISTTLVWAINFLNLLTTYLILLWTPAVLHSSGASPFQATFAASIYALGGIAGCLFMAVVVDRFAIERVLTVSLMLTTLTLLAIGQLDPRPWQLVALLLGAGLGGSSQGGINALCGLIYPTSLRATGTGWALGVGRFGAIAGPLVGGLLLARRFAGRQIFTVAAMSAFGAALLMSVLAHRRHYAGRSETNP
jgi:AAHS family 4-hydroxybenzoate transporter-like MFS transporter